MAAGLGHVLGDLPPAVHVQDKGDVAQRGIQEKGKDLSQETAHHGAGHLKTEGLGD